MSEREFIVPELQLWLRLNVKHAINLHFLFQNLLLYSQLVIAERFDGMCWKCTKTTIYALDNLTYNYRADILLQAACRIVYCCRSRKMSHFQEQTFDRLSYPENRLT